MVGVPRSEESDQPLRTEWQDCNPPQDPIEHDSLSWTFASAAEIMRDLDNARGRGLSYHSSGTAVDYFGGIPVVRFEWRDEAVEKPVERCCKAGTEAYPKPCPWHTKNHGGGPRDRHGKPKF